MCYNLHGWPWQGTQLQHAAAPLLADIVVGGPAPPRRRLSTWQGGHRWPARLLLLQWDCVRTLLRWPSPSRAPSEHRRPAKARRPLAPSRSSLAGRAEAGFQQQGPRPGSGQQQGLWARCAPEAPAGAATRASRSHSQPHAAGSGRAASRPPPRRLRRRRPLAAAAAAGPCQPEVLPAAACRRYWTRPSGRWWTPRPASPRRVGAAPLLPGSLLVACLLAPRRAQPMPFLGSGSMNVAAHNTPC